MRIADGLVTVILEGTAADHCKLDQATTALQAQQLAWTVIDNSDLRHDVAVRFIDASGQASERWMADSQTAVGK